MLEVLPFVKPSWGGARTQLLNTSSLPARGLSDLGSAKILVHTGHFRLTLPLVITTVATIGPGLLASTVT